MMVRAPSQNGIENTQYNDTQFNVLRLMKKQWKQIHIGEFHPETFSSGELCASLAHAD